MAMTLEVVSPQPTYIESSGRWNWPLPEHAQFEGCCKSVVTASREWWEYTPSEARPHPMAEGVQLRDGKWYWAIPASDQAHLSAQAKFHLTNEEVEFLWRLADSDTMTRRNLRDELEEFISALCNRQMQAKVQDDTAYFKNFHRSLCDRFGYTHDEIDWRRDLVSLEEHIVTLISRNDDLSDDTIRTEWRASGGFIHGPHTETVTMPEADYFRLRRSFAARLSQGAPVFVSDALIALEEMAMSGEQLHGDDIVRFHATVEKIAPQVKHGEVVAWQVRLTSKSGADWEACTKELYEETLRTGRYLGLPAGTKNVEVRQLYTHPAGRTDVPDGSYRDAYEGARDDLLDWKGRALRAEAELRNLGYTGIVPTAAPQPPEGARVGERDAEIERLNAIINTPQADDFLRAVSTEAEHQRQRWGNSHDAGKAPADWFWLIGYLAGKALHALAAGNVEKAEHHIITTAAALANWHRAMFGKTDMRPGIDGDTALAGKEGAE